MNFLELSQPKIYFLDKKYQRLADCHFELQGSKIFFFLDKQAIFTEVLPDLKEIFGQKFSKIFRVLFIR